jgi:hypothetical protein
MKILKTLLPLVLILACFSCDQEERIEEVPEPYVDDPCALNWTQVIRTIHHQTDYCPTSVLSNNWMEDDGLQVEQTISGTAMAQLVHAFPPVNHEESPDNNAVYEIQPTNARKTGSRFNLSLELGHIELDSRSGMIIGINDIIRTNVFPNRRILAGGGSMTAHSTAGILLKKEDGVYHLGFDIGLKFFWMEQTMDEVHGGIFSIEFDDKDIILSATLFDGQGLQVMQETVNYGKPEGDQYGFFINTRGIPGYGCEEKTIRYRLLDFQYAGNGVMDMDAFDCNTVY